MTDRARLTLPDLVFFLFSLAVFGALAPVLATALDGAASEMATGTAYVFRFFLPGIAVILLAVVVEKATRGARQ